MTKKNTKGMAAHAPGVDPHEHLRRADPRLAKVIERHGPSPLAERAKDPEAPDLHFAGLVRAIVSQQLSGKAADTIYGRLVALGGDALPPAADLAAIADEKLRAVGLSGAKARGVKDLAERVASGSLALVTLRDQGDEEVIEALTKVRGVGRWTAEMFLMFRLGRPDILSTADLGLRKGMMHLFGLDDLPDPRRMEELAEAWRPFRSIASWYLWRVAEDAPPHRRKEAAANEKKAKPAAKKRAAKVAALTKTKRPAKGATPKTKQSARKAKQSAPKAKQSARKAKQSAPAKRAAR